jgi:hypothetical protein
MGIPGLLLISSYWRRKQSRNGRSHHLMLAGIFAEVFLKEWGHPEFEIDTTKLKEHWELSPAVRVSTLPEGFHSLWIYKKRNTILFFTKKRLVSHFTWKGFEDRRNRLEERYSETGMGSITYDTSDLRPVA